MNPCIAIIDANTLSSIALKELIWDIFPDVEVLAFPSMEAFIADCNHHFVHFFVSAPILFAHAGEFDMLQKETIVTSEGPGPARRFPRSIGRLTIMAVLSGLLSVQSF